VDSEHLNNPIPTIYDIPIIPPPTPASNPLHALSLTQTPATLQKLAQLDDNLAMTIAAIAQSKAKHAFFESFAKDPANFVRRWVSSQRRDLEVILGDTNRGIGSTEEGTGEEWRRAGANSVWGSKQVGESVGLWLARQGKAH